MSSSVVLVDAMRSLASGAAGTAGADGAADPGACAINVLRLSSNVATNELIRFGADIWVVDTGAGATGDNTANDDFNTTSTVVITGFAAKYPNWVGGQFGAGMFAQIQSEIIKCTTYTGGTATFTRGHMGTTTAAHANGVSISQGNYMDSLLAGAGATLILPVFGGATPTFASAALVTAHGLYGTETGYTAVAISVNEVLFRATAVGVSTKTCTETLAGANNSWSAAATYGGRAASAVSVAIQARVPTANEVFHDHMYFAFGFTPTKVLVQVNVTSTGIQKLWVGGITITSGLVKIDNAGGTDWAATDTVTVTAFA